METKSNAKLKAMFIIPSITGIILFMIPVKNAAGEWTVVVKILADIISGAIGGFLPLLCVLILTVSAVMSVIALAKPKFIMNSDIMKECFACKPIWVVLRVLAVIFVWLTYLGVGEDGVGLIGMITGGGQGGFVLYDLLTTLVIIFVIAALLLPLLTLAAGLLARHLLIPHLMRKNPNNSTQALTAALCCVLTAFNLLTGAMLFSALSSGSFAEPGEAFIRIVNVLMGLMLIPMGNIMPKVKRNGAFGLRTRWSMANDTCWNRCQRMGGLSLMVTGALIVLGALLLPPAYSTVLMLLLILLDGVFSTVYSYQVYQKYGRN